LGFPFLSALGALAVSLGTADILAYLVLIVIAMFLITGPVIYIYYRRHQREEAAPAPEPTPSSG